MIKVLDFLSVPLAIFLATNWIDNVSWHYWVVALAVVATNLLGYARGVTANR